MGHNQDLKKKPSLRLVRDENEPVETVIDSPKPKSATARQLSSFADELDKQIAALLNM